MIYLYNLINLIIIMSSNNKLRVELKMKCFIQLARKCIVDNLEEEIGKTDNDELRESLVEKLTEILESDVVFVKPKTTIISVTNLQQKIPTEPVTVRGTPLKLKNMPSGAVYRKFCTSIADMLGYAHDFSDSPFNNLLRNARVYEGIKRLYSSGKIDQEIIDDLVKEAEETESLN